MIGEYARKSNVWVLWSIVVLVIYFLVRNSVPAPLPTIIQLAHNVLLIIGIKFYAQAKGYSPWLALLGLLSLLGLIILVVLPDRMKTAPEAK